MFKGLELHVTAASHISGNDAQPGQDSAALHQDGGGKENCQKRDLSEANTHRIASREMLEQVQYRHQGLFNSHLTSSFLHCPG
jgi:hypothetical protein